MSQHKEIESDFYFAATMAGIQQEAPDTFHFEGRRYKAHAWVDPATAKALGGKSRAFKLIRHARLIQHLAAQPQGAHIAGIVGKSFNAVCQQYPALRSYYEGMKVGGDHHAWLRF